MKKEMTAYLTDGMSAGAEKKRYYLIYTACFLILSVIVFSWFLFSGHSMIRRIDGYNQHYKALVYYGQYLRKIVGGLFSDGKLVIPQWDFAIGEGGDILNTLHYYVMGDPLALLAVFVPARLTAWFYGFFVVLRLYLAGLSFSVLCFGLGQENRFGILGGALSYCFCGWALQHSARHIIFLNPMILLPLILLGVHRVIRKGRPYLYVIAVAVAAASNFYFFYMIAAAVAVYAVVRVFTEERRFFSGLAVLFKLLGLALLGVCMAGLVLAPVLSTLFADMRLDIPYQRSVFYPWNYYSKLPSMLVMSREEYYLVLGFTAPTLPAAVLLFRSGKRDTAAKILLVFCMILPLFPAFGVLANGFSYAANRWCFALVLLVCRIITKYWDRMMDMDEKDGRAVLIAILAYAVLCTVCKESHVMSVYVVIALMLLLWIVLTFREGKRGGIRRQAAVCVLIACNIAVMALLRFSPSEGDRAGECVDVAEAVQSLTDNEAEAVKRIAAEANPRFTGRSLLENANMVSGISSTQYYWSLSDPRTGLWRSELALKEIRYQKYAGYDERAALMALSSVQYFVMDENSANALPYGMEEIETVDLKAAQKKAAAAALEEKTGAEILSEAQLQAIEAAAGGRKTLFRNPYALPSGYCCDTVITPEQWDGMDAVQKQQAQLKAIYVDDETALREIGTTYADQTDYTVPYELTCGNDSVTVEDGKIVVTERKASVTLTFKGLPDAETYVYFEGLDFAGTTVYDLYFGDPELDPLDRYSRTDWEHLTKSEQETIRSADRYGDPVTSVSLTLRSSAGSARSFDYLNGLNNYTSGRHDFLVNLGYSQKAVKSVRINFPERGVYTLAGLAVYCVPMEDFARDVLALAQDPLQDVRFETDSICGTVTLDRTKVLCVTVPYSDGWTALTDGQETPVFAANGRYLGVLLQAGEHTVEFYYETPYRREGGWITLTGFAGFAWLVVRTENRKKQTDGRQIV